MVIDILGHKGLYFFFLNVDEMNIAFNTPRHHFGWIYKGFDIFVYFSELFPWVIAVKKDGVRTARLYSALREENVRSALCG
jgi:hypothetical protein